MTTSGDRLILLWSARGDTKSQFAEFALGSDSGQERFRIFPEFNSVGLNITDDGDLIVVGQQGQVLICSEEGEKIRSFEPLGKKLDLDSTIGIEAGRVFAINRFKDPEGKNIVNREIVSIGLTLGDVRSHLISEQPIVGASVNSSLVVASGSGPTKVQLIRII
jgi:hypothetical protein